jgi:hypothetical protein
MNSRRNVLFCLLVMAGLTIIACAGRLAGTYGLIDPSSEATLAFDSYSVNPTYRYYISGSDVYPNALIGLSRDYHLDPETLWKEVEMTPNLMKEIVDHMKARASQLMQFPQGFNLVDDKGRVIGSWYSIITARTFVQMKKDGIVSIETPDINTYDKFERDRGHFRR